MHRRTWPLVSEKQRPVFSVWLERPDYGVAAATVVAIALARTIKDTPMSVAMAARSVAAPANVSTTNTALISIIAGRALRTRKV
jgi:hypothetical protein